MVGNAAAVKSFLKAGADPSVYTGTVGSITATPLMAAALNGNAELTRLFLTLKPSLEAKAADNDGTVKNGKVLFGSFTALHMGVLSGNPQIVDLLLDAGASVDPRDVRGLTPLALAIGTDHPEPRIIRALLNHGADVSLVSHATIASDLQENAIDWARKFNNPAALTALKLEHKPAAPAVPDLTASRNIPTAREAVERSLPILRTGSSRVMTDGACVACHAQPMTGLATAYASRRGWAAESKPADISQVVSSLTGGTAGLLQGREGGGLPDGHLFSAFMMAAANIPPSVATDAFVYYLLAKQARSGSWGYFKTRAPMMDSDITRTALAIRALMVYGTPARKTEVAAGVQRAAAWLNAQVPLTTEDRIMQLLGLSWASANQPLREKRVKELLALQRKDGGWAQTPYLESDAYATGQVLFTLRELGLAPMDPAIKRGVTYLLRTQNENGAWHVRSRAMKIQPYFESGFPFGHDQWISQAGTAWGVIALSVATEDPHRGDASK
jgi:hypothetical protein